MNEGALSQNAHANMTISYHLEYSRRHTHIQI